ncbi:hypothetical protein N9T87_00645 [bacterium]|nr:hypothetical protein [bacterium]
MSKNILKRSVLVVSLIVSSLAAQDKVDAIEAARQAKAAAERAAADAEAATDAAIEQAAKNAAKDARNKIKQNRIDEEARKAAEAKAAEEAELDAAAAAAAEDAKRRMAEELGLEYEAPVTNSAEESPATEEVSIKEEETEEIVVKEKLGYDLGFTGSSGFINGSYITNTPVGGSIVLKTPFGFDVGESLNLKISIAVGSYNGEGAGEPLEALFFGAGANATLFNLIFSETHLGMIGSGTGIRSFNGVSLEKLLNKGLNLPVNVLIGLEGFLATKADDVTENSTYWAGLGVRLNYSF